MGAYNGALQSKRFAGVRRDTVGTWVAGNALTNAEEKFLKLNIFLNYKSNKTTSKVYTLTNLEADSTINYHKYFADKALQKGSVFWEL
jgi:hypothetical protein